MRLAIISGGSTGLGLELCRQYEALGCQVVDFSRSGQHAGTVRVDLSDPVGSQEMVRRTLDGLATRSWDDIVIVNNAGTLEPMGPASRKPADQVLANMNVNFCSAILLLSAAIGVFQAHPCRKRIASISSGAATRGYAGWSLYCAAKAGVENFIRALACEQASETFPFEAVSINPGVMDTMMQSAIRSTDASDFPDAQHFVRRQQRGELRPPAVVAAAVLRIVDLAQLTPGAVYLAADHLA